jgi:replicative superfamily II helicase
LDDTIIAWALTDIPSNDWGYLPRDLQEECEEMKWKLKNRGIQASDAIHFSLAAYKCLTGAEIENGSLKADARVIKYDMYRVNQALELIDSMYAKWEKKNFWKILPARVAYGIPEEMVELVRIPGIGGVKARKLWEKGIHSLKEVVEKTDIMKLLFTPTMAAKIQKEARQILALQKEVKSG